MNTLRKYILAAYVCGLLSSVLRANTFTPIIEDDPEQTVAQTAVELWAGYDPTIEPLETELLYEWEEDGVVLQVVRYRVGVFGGETAMVAGIYGYPKEGTNLPGLVQIHGGGQFADYRACLTNAKRGYATLSVAWAGRIAATSPNDTGAGYTVTGADLQAIFDGGNFETEIAITTDWGPLEGYHAPSRFQSTNFQDLLPQAWTIDAVESPRNSTWFLWTMAARRGLTFLQAQPEVDGTKLGVYGHSMGGKLTVMTAGSDSRLRAAAPSCGGVSDFNKEAFYDVTIGDPGYWDMISCPVMFLKPANDFHAHIADVPTAVSVLEGNSNDWRVTTSPHHDHNDTSEYKVATQIWMDEQLKGGDAVPETPELTLGVINHSGVPTLTISADNTTRAIQSVEVYYTQAGEDTGEVHPFGDFHFRPWHYAAAQGSGADWSATLPIHDTNEPLWVFANVTYALDTAIDGAGYGFELYTADEYVISTPILSATSAELQAAGATATFAATTQIEDFQGDWQQEWYNYSEDSETWQNATHKFNDPIYAAPAYAKLALEVRSDSANTLVVRMNDAAVEVSLPGGSEWQEIELQPYDFHSATGTWAFDWETAKEFELTNFAGIVSYTYGAGAIVVGNQNWDGTAPEFRNLRWETGTREEYAERMPNPLDSLPVEDDYVYLSTAGALSVTSWLNITNNDGWYGDGVYAVNSTTYDRGVAVFSSSEIVYFIGGKFTRFEALATSGNYSGVAQRMQIYLDDVLAYDSGDLINGAFDLVDLDVSSAYEMRLVTTDSSEEASLQAAWVDAKLTPDQSDKVVIFSEDFEGTSIDGLTLNQDYLNIGNPVNSRFYFGWVGTDFAGVNQYTSGLTLEVVTAGGGYSNALNNLPAESYIGGATSGSIGWLNSTEADTQQSFVSGTEYEFSFQHYQASSSNTAGRGVTAEIYDVTSGTVYASQFFDSVDNKNVAQTRTLSYTATGSEVGNIGLRFIGDSVDHDDPETALPVNENNNYSAAIDNIVLTETAAVVAVEAEVYSANEVEYADDVSDTDLLHGLTPSTTGWVLGVNLLNDGTHGLSFVDAGNSVEGAYTTVGATATFDLGTGINGTGYDISSVQSIAAWNGGGFRNQAWTLEVLPVGGSWTVLETVTYEPFSDADLGGGASKVTLSDATGVLAEGIQGIRVTANSVAGNTNAGAFVWRELDVFGSASGPEAVPPTLVSMSPDTVVDGTLRSNISTKTKLVAKFNEDITLGSGAVTILNLDTLAETVITLPDAQVTVDPVDARYLMIEPSTELLANTRYAVCIDSTVVDDLSGNSFAGILDPVTWTFATRGGTPMKILCIGDSITVGYTDDLAGDPFNFGYRGHLYELLNDAGYVFQYVGGSTQPWDGSFGLDPTIGGTYKPEFDLRDLDQDYQQGGGGAPIGSLIGWLEGLEPDLILLKIGINSIQDGVAFETVRGYIYELVETIITEKPDAHLIVAQTIPYSGDYVSFPVNEGKNLVLRQYNAYIRDQLVADLISDGKDASKVSTADMYSMFLTDPSNYESAVAIGRHSNAYNHPWNTAVDGAGYDVMAQQWFDAIEALNIGPDSLGFWLDDPSFGIDPAEQGFDDDPDGDGLASGLEAWLGTHPNSVDTVGMTNLSTSGRVTTFQHPKNPNAPADLVGWYEWSMNLSDWYLGNGVAGPDGGPTVNITHNTSNAKTDVTATTSEDLESVFLRLSVSPQ